MLQLKNNFIFAPVKTGYSDKTGVITDKHIEFYTERSKYLGAITPEPLYIDKGLREIPTQRIEQRAEYLQQRVQETGYINNEQRNEMTAMYQEVRQREDSLKQGTYQSTACYLLWKLERDRHNLLWTMAVTHL